MQRVLQRGRGREDLPSNYVRFQSVELQTKSNYLNADSDFHGPLPSFYALTTSWALRLVHSALCFLGIVKRKQEQQSRPRSVHIRAEPTQRNRERNESYRCLTVIARAAKNRYVSHVYAASQASVIKLKVRTGCCGSFWVLASFSLQQRPSRFTCWHTWWSSMPFGLFDRNEHQISVVRIPMFCIRNTWQMSLITAQRYEYKLLGGRRRGFCFLT